MRFKPYYLTPVLVAGAAAAAIVAARPPSSLHLGLSRRASSPRPWLALTPAAHCGDFCGKYSAYGYYRGAPGIPAPPGDGSLSVGSLRSPRARAQSRLKKI